MSEGYKGQIMNTCFTTSPDDVHIAYEVSGSGPAIMLLHGGGSSRQEWHEGGYLERLGNDFTVITVDLRGHGESDRPTDPACYTSEKMGEDLLAVADACGVDRFILCGYSLGGNVGRYLAARSERVANMIMIGNPLGAGVAGEWRQLAVDFRARWTPVVQSQVGVFDPGLLSPQDQEDIRHLSFPGELVPAILALSSAMLEWPVLGPADIRCPSLWLFGSENKIAADSFKEYEQSLRQAKIIVAIFEGFTHEQEVEEIDQVLPLMLAFVRAENHADRSPGPA
jgi:pimeloyl-ACP methyl ester carboxylesterase